MSFFFTKPKIKPTKRAAPALAGKAAKDTLNRLGCKACPLDKTDNCTPKMPPDLGELPANIYFLGDTPSEADDNKGYPFSDKAGKLLRAILGNDAVDACFDNTVRDFDELKITQPWVAMECCRPLVTKSIEHAKPRLIVGLGILPLQLMLNSSDMVGLRGRVFAVKVGSHACWFLPTYHPQYVIDKAYEGQEPLRSKLGQCLKFDIARALSTAESLPKAIIDTPQAARAGVQAFNGSSRAQLAQVLKLISSARSAPEKAIDLETSHLRSYTSGAKVLTIALSYGETNFAFAMDHPKAGWLPDEKKALKHALSDLLSDQTKIIAHNAPFEVEWLIHLLGREVIFHDTWECTMMQAHFLDERRGKRGGNDDQFQPNPYQALDFLVKQYFGISFKALFKINRKKMAEADLDETLLYNGADTKYTLRLHRLHCLALKQRGIYNAYKESKSRQPTVALMQALGIDIDQAENKALRIKLAKEISETEGRINADAVVKRFISDRKAFNPASQQDVLRIFKDYIGAGKLLTNAAGKESVDKSTLSRIDHPLAENIQAFRNCTKLKSTYVDILEYGKGELIFPDGKIHPTFNTTFAETGRTSCDSPNVQNFPKRASDWIRKQIIAPKGHVLVAFDYGQLEGCTGAMCSKDKVFVKALWEDYDMHGEWARRTAMLWPAYIGGKENLSDKAIMKEFRGLIKNKLVFPAFFGAAKESIAGYLTFETGIEAPPHIIDKLFSEFWTAFSGTYRWQKRLMAGYYENGYVESLTGRRRHYPLGRPQAINYPVQSVACDIVCRAMVTLSERAADSGEWHLHPRMNIHDDLSFVIPDQPKLLEESIEAIYRVMLADVFSFVNVPMSVTCSIGNNWLEMTEIGKFWSNKDIR